MEPIAGASQTLTAYNPGDWSVSADMSASNTAVVSYPDVQQIYTLSSGNLDPLSNFHSITSTFAENGPGSGGGDDYEAAYDIWANNGSLEIMIWVDNHGQTPAGSKVATADIDGTSYSVWKSGSTSVSLVLNSNETNGTINILAALNWLESNGYEPAGPRPEPDRFRLGDLLPRRYSQDVQPDAVQHRVLVSVRLV